MAERSKQSKVHTTQNCDVTLYAETCICRRVFHSAYQYSLARSAWQRQSTEKHTCWQFTVYIFKYIFKRKIFQKQTLKELALSQVAWNSTQNGYMLLHPFHTLPVVFPQQSLAVIPLPELHILKTQIRKVNWYQTNRWFTYLIRKKPHKNKKKNTPKF